MKKLKGVGGLGANTDFSAVLSVIAREMAISSNKKAPQ